MTTGAFLYPEIKRLRLSYKRPSVSDDYFRNGGYAMLDTSKTFHAAVYLRLSREDGDVTDGSKQVSNSIANQNELVMDYL